MSVETIESSGPIQMLAVAFDGNRFRGEILPELDRLKRKRIIRVIDLLVVRKDGEGNVMVTTGSDLDWDEAVALGSHLGALAGLKLGGEGAMEQGSIAGAAELADGHVFDDDDVFRLTNSLGNNMTAALVLIQHTWAVPLLDAVDRAGGIELANEWIRADEVLTVEPQSLGDGGV